MAIEWIAFNLFVLLMLGLDLGVFHRKQHVVQVKEALFWSGFWITAALLFAVGVNHWIGKQPALEFLTGFLIEKSLSVDNIFVFLLIFSYFRVPQLYQHKVLFWGVVGALALRAAFILLGIGLLDRFHWVDYLFGGLLIFTGIKVSQHKDKQIKPERNPFVRLARRLIPVAREPHGGKFFVNEGERWVATPLFIVLLVIETTDVVFAFDSIPAILSISRDSFIVYTSNVFAIFGLRSLYFALAGLVSRFHFIHYGLSAILIFVGTKMLLSDLYHFSITISLAVIAGLLAASVIASILWPTRAQEKVLTSSDPSSEQQVQQKHY